MDFDNYQAEHLARQYGTILGRHVKAMFLMQLTMDAQGMSNGMSDECILTNHTAGCS